MTNSANCANDCQTKGLTILPVRYTVVPKYINRQLPAWANLSSVTSVSLDDEYQYHVRLLRQGFVYIYLPHLKAVNRQWMVFSVAPDGSLWKQPSPEMATFLTSVPVCHRKVPFIHDAARTEFICIPNIESCETIWVAFSEHKWSRNTLTHYEKMPDNRMQKIEPMQWQGQSESAIEAKQSTLAQVLDYDLEFDQKLLPYDGSDNVISGLFNDENEINFQPNLDDIFSRQKKALIFSDRLSNDENGEFGFDDKKLHLNSTCTPWPKNNKIDLDSIVYCMKKHSIGSAPMLIALNDSIGIANEMNGYCNEVIGKLVQYNQEKAFESSAISLIEETKKLVIDSELTQEFVGNPVDMPFVQKIMETGEMPNTYPEYEKYIVSSDPSTYIKYCKDLLSLEAVSKAQWFGKPGNAFHQARLKKVIGFYGPDAEAAFGHSDAQIHKMRIAYIKGLDKLFELEFQNGSYAQIIKEKGTKKWENNYFKRINKTRYNQFNKKQDELIKKISEINEKRVKQLINWLGQQSFLTNLMDYDRKSSDEGVLYQNVLQKITLGIESSKAGKEQMKTWVDIESGFEDGYTKNNLIWQAIALNNDDILLEIRDIFSFIQKRQTSGDKTFEDDSFINDLQERFQWKKLADFYKKAQTFANAQNNMLLALKEQDTITKTIMTELRVNSFINNSIILKFSDAMTKQFMQTLLDPLSLAAFKAFTMTSSGVSKSAVFVFLKADFQFWRLIKESIKPFGQIRTSRWYLNGQIEQWKYKMDKAFESVMKDVDKPLSGDKLAKNNIRAKGPGKDIRLSSLLVLFELYNWAAMQFTDPELANQPDFRIKKAAAIAGLNAAISDLAANYVKAVKGSESIIFGRVKIFSGCLMFWAGLHAADIEAENAAKAKARGHENIALLHSVNKILLTFSSLMAVPTVITYHVSFSAFILTKTLYRSLAKQSLTKAARTALARTLILRVGMLALGIWISVIVLGIQGIIYLLETNELEDWCERCAFGLANNNGYSVLGQVVISPFNSSDKYSEQYKDDPDVKLVVLPGTVNEQGGAVYEYRRYHSTYNQSVDQQNKVFLEAIKNTFGIDLSEQTATDNKSTYKLSFPEAMNVIEQYLIEQGL